LRRVRYIYSLLLVVLLDVDEQGGGSCNLEYPPLQPHLARRAEIAEEKGGA
jgi:hypothetical protein